MIERAKRETSLFMGRKKTHQLRKPFDGIRPETVCSAIYAQYGIASTIAQALGVHYCTFNNWKNQHQWIKDALQEAREQMLDVAENSLLRSVEKQEGWATCFLLKCRGKERGYVEKLMLGGGLDNRVVVSVAGPDGEEDPLEGIN